MLKAKTAVQEGTWRSSSLFYKREGRTAMAMVAALLFAVHSAMSADYITLQGSDTGSAASFIQNNPAPGCGWSNGLDPQPGLDYYVGKNLILQTPGSVEGAETYSFPGRSLTLDGGTLRTVSLGQNVVQIDDLIVKTGTLDDNGYSYSCTFDGKITIQNSVKFWGGTGAYYFDLAAKMMAPSTATAAYSTESKDSASNARWRTKASRRYKFSGDCSEYLALNAIDWNGELHLDCPTFAGSVAVNNIGRLKLLRDGMSVTGKVAGRDGWLQVPSNVGLFVRELDFAFAEPDSYIKNGVNCYTMQPDDGSIPDKTRTVAIYGGTFYRNAITVDNGATLESDSAVLTETQINLGVGAAMTVGDATFDGIRLNMSEGSVVHVTNSLVVNSPVIIPMSVTSSDAVLVTLPVGKGVLNPLDFQGERGPFQCTFGVRERDGLQELYLVANIACGRYDATTGYVVLTNSESSSAKDKTSWSTAGWWSDGEIPHATTNYYTSRTLRFRPGTFAGKSLTLDGGTHRVDTTKGTETTGSIVNDLRIFGGVTFSSSSNGGTRYLGGNRWTLLNTPDAPLWLMSSRGATAQLPVFVIDAGLYGDENSSLQTGYEDIYLDSELSPCEFIGDMSHFFGTCRVRNASFVKLGNSGFPGTIRVETVNNMLTTIATNGAVVRVGKLVLQASMPVEVPAVNVLSVTDGVTLAGTLEKRGDGTLALGGAATANAGAALNVSVGALKPLSATAVAGLPVSFAAGTKVVLDWEPADAVVTARGLDLSQSSFTLGDALTVEFDCNGMVPEKRTYVKALFTVADVDVPKIDGKIVIGRVKGFSSELLPPVSTGGNTTYLAAFSPKGMMIIFR